MVRTEMGLLDMLSKKQYCHYRCIFQLTLEFGEKENGLQQKHYRYALQKGGKDSLQMKKFFSDSAGNDLLEELYTYHFIEKDCINADNTLSNFLKLLVDRGWLEIMNPKEKNKRYKVAPYYFNEWNKIYYKYLINATPTASMYILPYAGQIPSLKDVTFQFCFLGLTHDFIKKLPKADRKKFGNDYLNKIINGFGDFMKDAIELRLKHDKKNKHANELHFFATMQLNPDEQTLAYAQGDYRLLAKKLIETEKKN